PQEWRIREVVSAGIKKFSGQKTAACFPMHFKVAVMGPNNIARRPPEQQANSQRYHNASPQRLFFGDDGWDAHQRTGREAISQIGRGRARAICGGWQGASDAHTRMGL